MGIEDQESNYTIGDTSGASGLVLISTHWDNINEIPPRILIRLLAVTIPTTLFLIICRFVEICGRFGLICFFGTTNLRNNVSAKLDPRNGPSEKLLYFSHNIPETLNFQCWWKPNGLVEN